MEDAEPELPVVYRSDSVSVVLDGPDTIIVGDPAAIEAVVAGLDLSTRARECVEQQPVPADVLALIGTIVGMVGTHQELLRPTAETAAKLGGGAQYLPGRSGQIVGQLRDGATKRFAGPAKFERVVLAPEQALSFQMAMTTLALRAAIAEVARAVEEVDAKVEVVKALLEARKIGDVRGRYKFLRAQVDQLESTGRLSNTDWSAVAPLGSVLETDLESIRAYISQRVSDAAQGGSADDRADALDRIEELRVDLDLLVVAQASLYLWHVLRVQHTCDTEPDHLAQAMQLARSRIAAQQVADIGLLGEMRSVGETLTRIRALEYHRLISRPKIEADVDELNDLLMTFAGHRFLDFDPIPAVEQPTAREALDAAEAVSREAARATGRAARAAGGWVGRKVTRDAGPEAPALGSSETADQPSLEPGDVDRPTDDTAEG